MCIILNYLQKQFLKKKIKYLNQFQVIFKLNEQNTQTEPVVCFGLDRQTNSNWELS